MILARSVTVLSAATVGSTSSLESLSTPTPSSVPSSAVSDTETSPGGGNELAKSVLKYLFLAAVVLLAGCAILQRYIYLKQTHQPLSQFFSLAPPSPPRSTSDNNDNRFSLNNNTDIQRAARPLPPDNLGDKDALPAYDHPPKYIELEVTAGFVGMSPPEPESEPSQSGGESSADTHRG